MSIKVGIQRVQVTKRSLLYEVNNSVCHNYYYLIQGRIFHENGHTYKRFRFVIMFDIFDVQEYIEKDKVTKRDINDYLNEIIFCHTDSLNDWDNLSNFYSFCKESIDSYNNLIDKKDVYLY